VALETAAVLRQAARAHRQLAELKGAAGTIPNETILIDTLALQEAKDSSEVENIVTTDDEVFQGDAASAQFPSVSAKEVHNYAGALKLGFARVRQQRFCAWTTSLPFKLNFKSAGPVCVRCPARF
jgi:Fic family protein